MPVWRQTITWTGDDHGKKNVSRAIDFYEVYGGIGRYQATIFIQSEDRSMLRTFLWLLDAGTTKHSIVMLKFYNFTCN